MLSYTVRPLTPAARARMSGRGTEHSPFTANWSATAVLWEKEIRQLGGRNVVLMVDCTEADLRNDGMLRANARLASPAVAVAFESRKQGPLMFACGRYRTWQDNLRAIALGLEALRKVERYGIVASDEQYTGFQALTAGEQWPTWAMLLAAESGMSYEDAYNDPKTAFRLASQRTHPDVRGTADRFRAVKEAFDQSQDASGKRTAHV
jgi:hypothetical protein